MKHKLVYRLYKEDGLNLWLKRPHRNVSAATRERQSAPQFNNETWSMRLVSDALLNNRRLEALTVIDSTTRIAAVRGLPRSIHVEKGPEFISKTARHTTTE